MKKNKIIFPVAVKPPKLVKSYGPRLGYIAAGILVVFAVLHLFRIDKLVPIMDGVIPGSTGTTELFIIIVILSEVFGIPFLLRIKLSPLAHIVSGFFAVLAPLLWTLVAIWSYGVSGSTGQFSIISLPSNLLLVVLNFLWLSFNFVTLWTLGYNNLSVNDIFKK